jgi:hypothetical protein
LELTISLHFGHPSYKFADVGHSVVDSEFNDTCAPLLLSPALRISIVRDAAERILIPRVRKWFRATAVDRAEPDSFLVGIYDRPSAHFQNIMRSIPIGPCVEQCQ